MTHRTLVVDGVAVMRFVAGMQERPIAEDAVALADLGTVVSAVLDQLSGHWLTSEDDALLDALSASGATLVRYSHIYRRSLRGPVTPTISAGAFGPTRLTAIDRPAAELARLSRRAYPAGHVDHDATDADETTRTLQELLDGSLVGEYLAAPSAQALDAEVLVGACIVNRAGGRAPEGEPWVTEVFRDPDARYSGLGRRLLEHALQALAAEGETALGLAVTDGNPARRVYEALGFEWAAARRKLGIPERV